MLCLTTVVGVDNVEEDRNYLVILIFELVGLDGVSCVMKSGMTRFEWSDVVIEDAFWNLSLYSFLTSR